MLDSGGDRREGVLESETSNKARRSLKDRPHPTCDEITEVNIGTVSE